MITSPSCLCHPYILLGCESWGQLFTRMSTDESRFSLSDIKKLVTKSSVTQSVIIRVKLNLRLKHTTENHGDNASHGCPRMCHGFFITRPIFGPTDQREVIINYRIHFSHGCSRIPSATRCLCRSARNWLILWHVLISLCHSPQTFCQHFST